MLREAGGCLLVKDWEKIVEVRWNHLLQGLFLVLLVSLPCKFCRRSDLSNREYYGY